MSRYVALVPAAGVGARFGADIPKQYVHLAGQTVLQHTVDGLLAAQAIDQVVVVVSADDAYIDAVYPSDQRPDRLLVWRCGGASRAATVFNGIDALFAAQLIGEQDWLLVHDAARCCLSATVLQRLMDTLSTHAVGGLLAVPVADTLKRANDTQGVAATLSRTQLWQAQTPQMFRAGLLFRALGAADMDRMTDESSAIEALGLVPQLVPGCRCNIKLTHAEDALMAQLLLNHAQDKT